jgi:diguanylate cyclase (GGDEF)-like protein/PAS domain S-box-containing protein
MHYYLSYFRCIEDEWANALKKALELADSQYGLIHTFVYYDLEQPLHCDSTSFDITEKITLKKENERLLNQLKAMIEKHEAIMLIIDPLTGKILDSNPAATAYYGYSRNELQQMTIQQINMLPDEEVDELRLKAFSKGQKYFTFPHQLKNGEIRKVDVYSSPIPYNDNTVLFSIIFDVTEREKANEKIIYISYHDYLTGLYNRRFFEEEFIRLNTADNFPLAIIMGDVNGLKLINDAFGHSSGDIVLKGAADLLQFCAREQDIAARVGGDEFALILPGADEQEVKNRVKQFEINNNSKTSASAPLSISFGYAIQKSPGDTLDVLMKEAEGLMYANKYYDDRSIKGKTVEIIMNTLFEKSAREKMHSERVGKSAASIAESMGLSAETVNRIRTAGYLHDIGKIGIIEKILNKNDLLNNEEWLIMKSHAERSHRILVNTIEFSEISSYVLYHHERWDGKGYPEGLQGRSIPLESRIIAVADSYDAMIHERNYCKKKTRQEAIEEMLRCSGSQFDPEVVVAFMKLVEYDLLFE